MKKENDLSRFGTNTNIDRLCWSTLCLLIAYHTRYATIKFEWCKRAFNSSIIQVVFFFSFIPSIRAFCKEATFFFFLHLHLHLQAFHNRTAILVTQPYCFQMSAWVTPYCLKIIQKKLQHLTQLVEIKRASSVVGKTIHAASIMGI